MSESLAVPTSDGRSLEVVVQGPPDGAPVLFHHGTPGAAVPQDALSAAAGRRELRTIFYSRPGYGESTSQPGRTVADVARDVSTILDTLGCDWFLTLGWSGGGPHALATAALLGGRCRAAATIAGVAPSDAAGLDWLDGMGEENLKEFGAALQGADVLTDYLDQMAPAMEHITAHQVADALASVASPVDVAALDGPMGGYVAGLFRHSVAHGIDGWRDDDLAFCRPWGFDVADITVPVSVWQGRADRMVPYAHGEWLAARVPSARVHLFEGEGHISLLSEPDRVLDELVETSGSG